MLLVGLTGGIGMGKSTVASYLAESGERVIDTDELARTLVEPGQPALDEIRTEFGAQLTQPDGMLDRRGLAALVFGNPEKRARLEAILHPRIRAGWLTAADRWRQSGANRAVVVIPLLFEAGAEKEFDVTICVACSVGEQSRRLLERGWSRGEIEKRNASQRPVSEKMDRSDRVIWNEATLEICKLQAKRIFARI